MIFSSKSALIAMERMMTQPPFYRPPGHGKYHPKKLPPDKAHYKCEYCLHYDRKKKCELIQCPYMDERIKAGAVTLPEALVETMKDIHNTAFRKRFNKMLMKSEERKMISFRSEVHRKAFLNAIENIDPDNKVVIAALYLLTADRILWKQASRFVNGSHIDFEHIKAVNNSTDSYALLCVAKDFCLGTKHISVSELADEDIIRNRIFLLICHAMLIRRYGYNEPLYADTPNPADEKKEVPND